MAAQRNDRRPEFVRQYLVDLCATKAAIRAGYSPRRASPTAARLMKDPGIQAAIAEAMAERVKRTEITADYVLETIRDTVERCRQAQPVVDRKGQPVLVKTPSGDVAPAYSFDAQGVLRGAELLGKHLKLFTEKHEHSGQVGPPVLNLILNHESDAPSASD